MISKYSITNKDQRRGWHGWSSIINRCIPLSAQYPFILEKSMSNTTDMWSWMWRIARIVWMWLLWLVVRGWCSWWMRLLNWHQSRGNIMLSTISFWVFRICTLSLLVKSTKNILGIEVLSNSILLIFILFVGIIFICIISFEAVVCNIWFMISTKLSKNAGTSNLLIEFSESELCTAIGKFYYNCKEEGVLTKRSS